MRWLLTAILAIGLFRTAAAEQNNPTAEVKAVLDRAIQAAGGKEKLMAVKAIRAEGSATYHGELFPLSCDVSGAVRFPGQKRMGLDFGVDGLRTTYTEVLNGEQGWIKARGQTRSMNADQLAATQADVYLNWLTLLVPLSDRAFHLTSLGESQVNGQAVRVIQVCREGRPDIKLHFKRDDGLLVKAEVSVNVNQSQEYYYSDYKSFQGVQRATGQTVQRNGKNFLDVHFTKVTINPELGANEFNEP